jgi:tRNA (guanine-N7-)-methyltransferase
MTDETRDSNDGAALALPPDSPGGAHASDLTPYFFTLRDVPPAPLNLPDLFGNENPLEVEVGTGRGLFLVNAGTTCPGTNFLGVEYDYKEARRAARRLQKRELANVRILGADASVVLPRFLPDACAQALHVYFPDPWWKRRHKRRRVFNAEFLNQAARILESGALLHAWTDVEEYFGVMTALVAANPEFAPLPPPSERQAEHDMDYHTSFERKKRKLGLTIFRARWIRREQTAS